MSTSTAAAQTHHRRAVRFFWGLLIGATTVSLMGNVLHAVLLYVPRVVVQIGAAAVPIIGTGAFTVSFLTLRDLMLAIGYSADTAWIFPTIIDTAVAVSTMMLVALGDKPARRVRTANLHLSTLTSRQCGP